MASIGYDQTTAFGAYTFQGIRGLRTAQQNMARIKQVMDDLTAGGTQTTNLEGPTATMFKVTPGQGQNFYNAIVSIITAIGTLQAVTDLDQG